MVSPWPKGSPFWYPTGTVTWVMEFDVGGYFLHDASWEPNSMFGPGSENTSIAAMRTSPATLPRASPSSRGMASTLARTGP